MTKWRMTLPERGVVVIYEVVPSVFNAEDEQWLWEDRGGEGPPPLMVKVVKSNAYSIPVGSIEYWPRAMLEDIGPYTLEEP